MGIRYYWCNCFLCFSFDSSTAFVASPTIVKAGNPFDIVHSTITSIDVYPEEIGDEIILDQMTQESVSLNLNEFPDISVFSKNGVKMSKIIIVEPGKIPILVQVDCLNCGKCKEKKLTKE